MLKIGVLVSGGGTNLQKIIDEIGAGSLDAEIVLVASSRPDAYGIERAKAAGIDTLVLNRDAYDSGAADAAIAQAMMDAGADYLVMAGYMRLVGKDIFDAYPDRVINLHPALLPSFPGAHGIQDAFDAGVKVTGVTVHFANEVYDEGPIIAQRAVAVREDDTVDTLEERIHATEYELYPWVLRHLAAGDIVLGDDRKVHVANAD